MKVEKTKTHLIIDANYEARTHVMGKLMHGVFGLHDRSRYELYAFSLADPRHDDALTASFRGLARRFVNVSALNDPQAARHGIRFHGACKCLL